MKHKKATNAQKSDTYFNTNTKKRLSISDFGCSHKKKRKDRRRKDKIHNAKIRNNARGKGRTDTTDVVWRVALFCVFVRHYFIPL